MQLYKFFNIFAIATVLFDLLYNLYKVNPWIVLKTFFYLVLKIVMTQTQTEILSYNEEDARDRKEFTIFVILLCIADAAFGFYAVVRDEHSIILTILSIISLVLIMVVAIVHLFIVDFAHNGITGRRIKLFYLYRLQNVSTFSLDIFDIIKYAFETSIQYLQRS